jgi:hypothetical protein
MFQPFGDVSERHSAVLDRITLNVDITRENLHEVGSEVGQSRMGDALIVKESYEPHTAHLVIALEHDPREKRRGKTATCGHRLTTIAHCAFLLQSVRRCGSGSQTQSAIQGGAQLGAMPSAMPTPAERP